MSSNPDIRNLVNRKRSQRSVDVRKMLGGWLSACNPFTSIKGAVKRVAAGDPVREQILDYGAFDNGNAACSVSFLKIFSRLWLFFFIGLQSIALFYMHPFLEGIIFNSAFSIVIAVFTTGFVISMLGKKSSPAFDVLVLESENPMISGLMLQEPFALEHALVENGFTGDDIKVLAKSCAAITEIEFEQNLMMRKFPDSVAGSPKFSVIEQVLLERACSITGVSATSDVVVDTHLLSSPPAPSSDLLSMGIDLSHRKNEVNATAR